MSAEHLGHPLDRNGRCEHARARRFHPAAVVPLDSSVLFPIPSLVMISGPRAYRQPRPSAGGSECQTTFEVQAEPERCLGERAR